MPDGNSKMPEMRLTGSNKGHKKIVHSVDFNTLQPIDALHNSQ
jgi:hypothetical protein